MTDDLLKRCMAIDGWMGEEELRWLSEQASKSRVIAEVGCWKGRTSLCLAESTSGVVFAVDHFKGSEEHQEELKDKCNLWLAMEFCRNFNEAGINYIKCSLVMNPSLEASEMFVKNGVKLDMVFLDASHDYTNVAKDILAWMPLVMKGGILCGHDYQPSWPGVMRAVDELLPNRQLLEPRDRCSIWSVVV